MRISQRYNGPPDSAHGGVTVGSCAELVQEGPVEVRLLSPPPLETDLAVSVVDHGLILVSGPNGDVARIRSLDTDVEVGSFMLVSDDAMREAEANYLHDVEHHGHPFPSCFGCGPERREGDGLRQFAGKVPGQETVAARFSVDADVVPPWMVWAGLDCPSAGAVGLAADRPPAVVLGTMSGQVAGPVAGRVEYQVRSRLVGVDGRKHTAEVAMLSPDGDSVAEARAVWIAIDPSQFGPPLSDQ